VLALLHPVALAVSPVLALLAQNYGEIPPELSVRSFAIAAFGTLAGLGLLTPILRDLQRAAAIVSIAVVLFFSYGHIYAALEAVHVWGVQLGRHRHLLPAYGLLFIGALWLVVHRVQARQRITEAFAVAALAMSLTSAGSLGLRIVKSSWAWSASGLLEAGASELTAEGLGKKPDIYYIILDAYARSDVMTAKYGLDNSEILDQLTQQGFYVAQQSSSNYVWTALSLASSLNMRYVQDLGLPLTFGSYPAIFADPIEHSLVRYELEKLGYDTVAFETGYLPTELEDADHYLRAVPPEARERRTLNRLNSFETLLVHSSAGLAILDFLGPRVHSLGGGRGQESYETMRTIILGTLDGLEETTELVGPKFVFAHLVAPHAPYLFGRGGEYLNPEGPFTLRETPGGEEAASESVLYRDQAFYITDRIARVVEFILQHSNEPPVIIVQADHGPGIGGNWQAPDAPSLWHRLAILNLYYLPYGCQRQLYPSISPVNTFRLVLSCYFGLDYPLLEDRSYFSYWPREYSYEFVEMDPRELQVRYPLQP
jgi:hypothetical protein